ncbi:TetR/AcrR family transcriptional regulator [Paenibacillus sp. tmac-D7]|uniref:TetR/AcrR family transcriptional regulator n=1 Tax=Paenibacillus sp. tmac-D7 TaxID=2591462 RepID=UPI001144592C|nr:TetR/AcrR family transcriptional regulator [Paenibacillus sp. tmac-D7]
MDPKKTAILNAAKKSFSLFGYKGTTMGHIAKIAGVGKGTLYLYVTSKEELLNEIVSVLVEDMKRTAEEAIGQGATVFEKIHGAIYAALMFRKEQELLIKLAHEVNEFGSQVTENALDQIENQMVDYISQLIERAVSTGGMKPCDPKITAFIVYKLYLALVYDWERQHPPLTDERILELLQTYLMNGLSTK